MFVSRLNLKRAWGAQVPREKIARFEEFFSYPHFFIRIGEASGGSVNFHSGYDKYQRSSNRYCEVIIPVEAANTIIVDTMIQFLDLESSDVGFQLIRPKGYFEEIKPLPPFHDYHTFNKATKELQKHNKSFKKFKTIPDSFAKSASMPNSTAVAESSECNLLLQKAKEVMRGGGGEVKILALDLEVYEENHNCLTELGLSIYSQKGNSIETSHYIVEEHLSLRNGKYVPDRKNAWAMGVSKVLPLCQVIQDFIKVLESVDVIVGHDISSDFDFIRKSMSFTIDRITPTSHQISRTEAIDPVTSQDEGWGDISSWKDEGASGRWNDGESDACDEKVRDESRENPRTAIGVIDYWAVKEESVNEVNNNQGGGDMACRNMKCRKFHVFDTKEIGSCSGSLEKSLALAGIQTNDIIFHNAAYDAYGTILLFLSIVNK